MKTFIAIALSLLLSNVSYEQKIQVDKTKALAVEILTKTAIKVGDTISFRVRNLSSGKRGFTVEAISSSKSPEYENAVYTAFFNSDTVFFKNLKISQQRSKEKKLPYILPDYVLHAYEVDGSSEKYFSFIIKGTSRQKRALIRLRIASDIVADEQEITYSGLFPVFVLPD